MKLFLPFRGSKNPLKVFRANRFANYTNQILNRLTERFKFKEFSSTANYRFFQLAYTLGTCAVYKPKTNLNINLYDSLIVFKYIIKDTTRTKNNLPLYIEADPEEVKNSGGLLPSGPLEIGKDVVIYWTHSVNIYPDLKRVTDVYFKELVDIDEIIAIARYALRVPYVVTGKQKGEESINKYLEDSFNNNSVLFIDETAATKINIKQPTINADNYLAALRSDRTAILDELLGSLGFQNLGRGETYKKERLLTDEIKVESDATNSILYDYIHKLEEFAYRFEQLYKKPLTPLISINGAYVDLITAHKYFKIKGAGASNENNQSLSDILLNDTNGSGNSINIGRYASGNDADFNSSDFGSNNSNNDEFSEVRYEDEKEYEQARIDWTIGKSFTIENKNQPLFYTQSFYNNFYYFMDYLSHNEPDLFEQIGNDEIFKEKPIDVIYPNIINNYSKNLGVNNNINLDIKDDGKWLYIPPLDTYYYKRPFSSIIKDMKSTLNYYFSLCASYINAGFALSLPSILAFGFLSLLYASGSTFHPGHDIEWTWPKEFKENQLQQIGDFSSMSSIDVSQVAYVWRPIWRLSNWIWNNIKVLPKKIAWKMFPASLIGWLGKQLTLFFLRSLIYKISYKINYALLNEFSKSDNIIAKHYITVFNSASITGYLMDSSSIINSVGYGLGVALSQHFALIINYIAGLAVNDKSKMVNLFFQYEADDIPITTYFKMGGNFVISTVSQAIIISLNQFIINKLYNSIIDPEEGLAKKSIKLIFKGIKKGYSLSSNLFKETYNKLFNYFISHHPLENSLQKPYDFIEMGIEGIQQGSEQFLEKNIHFMINTIYTMVANFFYSIRDYIAMEIDPINSINKKLLEEYQIDEEISNLKLSNSFIDIINENPQDENKEELINNLAFKETMNYADSLITGKKYKKPKFTESYMDFLKEEDEKEKEFINKQKREIEIKQIEDELKNIKEKPLNIIDSLNYEVKNTESHKKIKKKPTLNRHDFYIPSFSLSDPSFDYLFSPDHIKKKFLSYISYTNLKSSIDLFLDDLKNKTVFTKIKNLASYKNLIFKVNELNLTKTGLRRQIFLDVISMWYSSEEIKIIMKYL